MKKKSNRCRLMKAQWRHLLDIHGRYVTCTCGWREVWPDPLLDGSEFKITGPGRRRNAEFERRNRAEEAVIERRCFIHGYVLDEGYNACAGYVPSGPHANDPCEFEDVPQEGLVATVARRRGIRICDQHGGVWGDDGTCERCTHFDGTPRDFPG